MLDVGIGMLDLLLPVKLLRFPKVFENVASVTFSMLKQVIFHLVNTYLLYLTSIAFNTKYNIVISFIFHN